MKQNRKKGLVGEHMLRIGLTGGIGSGKSTVSKIFHEEGIHVIDADKIARKVLDIYPEINDYIRDTYGNQYFEFSGKLKRKEFGNRIFSNKDKRIEFEKIIIPFIKKEIFSEFEKYNVEKEKFCVLDAPTLIEQGLYHQMDKNILVWVDKETQVKRVKERDNLNEKEIEDRIKSQMDLDEKIKICDFVIDNTKDRAFTKTQVKNIISRLKTKAD